MESNIERSVPQAYEYEKDGSQEVGKESQDGKQLGAKVLSLAHFESGHKSIVESSFKKARKNGEVLPGKNDERRNYSYLKRLYGIVEKYGNKGEQELWRASIKGDLLVRYDNIPESYWNIKRQELRDNGYGDYELTEDYKREIYEEERKLQKKSLEKWANYLGDEHSPYPLWFKVYAWDGMTKMGRYDKRKRRYEARNKTTVAPYPNPDAEVLAGVLDVVSRYYGNSERELYTEEGARNVRLEQIVQTGSFPKIFNAIQRDIAPVVEPPEKTEDVRGEWIEYELGDEDDIAKAARGTGWCIASPSVGKHYLEYGTYGDYDLGGDDEEYGDGGYDLGYGVDDEEYGDDSNRQNRAKFIMFHLVDQKNDKLAKNACASIRLDQNGVVAEISGLKDGQALDDSLVSIVEEKVKTLPGGEDFLQKFADKNMLIALDRKMKKGDDLTVEELEFIYEIHRPIQTLDTYNAHDPRIDELKQKYDVPYALEAGLEANLLFHKLHLADKVKDLDALIAHGASVDIDKLVSDCMQMCPSLIVANLDSFTSHGAKIDADELVSSLDVDDVIESLDVLVSLGVDIDNLVSNKFDVCQIAENLDTLTSHGAKIDADELVSSPDQRPSIIAKNLGALVAHGANIDNIVYYMDDSDVVKNLDTLIAYGAGTDKLAENMGESDVTDNLDTLIAHSADIYKLISHLAPDQILMGLDALMAHGAKIDDLVSDLYPPNIADNLDALIAHGANIGNLVSRMPSSFLNKKREVLRGYGANV